MIAIITILFAKKTWTSLISHRHKTRQPQQKKKSLMPPHLVLVGEKNRKTHLRPTVRWTGAKFPGIFWESTFVATGLWCTFERRKRFASKKWGVEHVERKSSLHAKAGKGSLQCGNFFASYICTFERTCSSQLNDQDMRCYPFFKVADWSTMENWSRCDFWW